MSYHNLPDLIQARIQEKKLFEARFLCRRLKDSAAEHEQAKLAELEQQLTVLLTEAENLRLEARELANLGIQEEAAKLYTQATDLAVDLPGLEEERYQASGAEAVLAALAESSASFASVVQKRMGKKKAPRNEKRGLPEDPARPDGAAARLTATEMVSSLESLALPKGLLELSEQELQEQLAEEVQAEYNMGDLEQRSGEKSAPKASAADSAALATQQIKACPDAAQEQTRQPQAQPRKKEMKTLVLAGLVVCGLVALLALFLLPAKSPGPTEPSPSLRISPLEIQAEHNPSPSEQVPVTPAAKEKAMQNQSPDNPAIDQPADTQSTNEQAKPAPLPGGQDSGIPTGAR